MTISVDGSAVGPGGKPQAAAAAPALARQARVDRARSALTLSIPSRRYTAPERIADFFPFDPVRSLSPTGRGVAVFPSISMGLVRFYTERVYDL
jgi:hypothetical protein